MKPIITIAIFVALGAAAVAQAQQPALTSRDLQEMFYTDTLPPAKPAAVKKQNPPATAPVAAPAATAAAAAPRKPAPQATESDQSQRRVGIKFRIEQWNENGEIRDVDTSKVFHSGDRVRFEVESNIDGYLYVIQKGSSGTVSTLFPHVGINDGNNFVQRSVKYMVPANNWFAFDQRPGEEDLMVILSRTPLESLPPRPSIKAETQTQVLPAVLTELDRRVQSRDLVIFPEQKQTTDYASIVVNTSADKNDVVYAQVVLKHQ